MSRGSVFLRKDGRWEARLPLGSVNGKRQSRSFYGATREEAEQKMLAGLYLLKEPILTEMSVKELCTEWLGVMSSRLKISTLANYRMKMEKHIVPLFGGLLTTEMTSHAVQMFIDRKLKEGLSARYVCDIVVLLKSVFKYAQRMYRIPNRLDSVIMPKCVKPDVRILTPYQQNTLISHLAHDITPTTLGIALALLMGLRLGEVCALKWSDIDFEKRILSVKRTAQRVNTNNGTKRTELVIMQPKSASSVRDIPIPGLIFVMLKKMYNGGDCYIISGRDKPLEPRTMQYRFGKLLDRLGLPKVTYHSLRHRFASTAVEVGFDIKTLSEILGHSRVEVTLGRYVHSSIDRKRSCMELMRWSA